MQNANQEKNIAGATPPRLNYATRPTVLLTSINSAWQESNLSLQEPVANNDIINYTPSDYDVVIVSNLN